MKQIQLHAGYTIVEVMIFLVISVGLFGTAVLNINTQNNRTQFNQTIDTLQLRFQDSLNDVSTGYYPSNSNFSCVSSPAGPNLTTAAPKEQGKNTGCIFVGKTIQFAPDSNGARYDIYTMVGNRLDASGKEVSNKDDAKPRLLAALGRPGIVDQPSLTSGVVITRVLKLGDLQPIGGVALISDFGQTSSIGNTVSGNASRVTLAAVNTTTLNMPSSSFAGAIETSANIDFAGAANGILVCLREQGGTRTASITIGSRDGQQLSLTKTIDPWLTECN
jgi:hypothetical protein